MINLNINLTIKPDQIPDENAAYVAAFINALEAKGYTMCGETVKPVKAQEKGEKELAWLEKSGNKRMKVPSSWNGTREQWAEKLLADESPVVYNEEPKDDYSVLHDDE